MADNRSWIEKANSAFVIEQLLDDLEYHSCDLICVNVPSGDDYSIEWIVIEHHLAEPREREIGRGNSALKALKMAFGDKA